MRTEAEDLLGHFEPRTVLKVFTVSSSLREPVLVSVNLWKRHLRYCNRTEAVVDQKKRPAETSLHYVKRPIRTKTSRFEANGERKKRREMAVFRCRAALQLVGLIALMVATVPSESAAPSGSVRSSKMKPPPIIPKESSNKNRHSSGKSCLPSQVLVRFYRHRCNN